jgi:hypothetical protein
MSNPRPVRRKTERAVRDASGNPVTLLYDESTDSTVMARGTATGEVEVSDLDDYWNQVLYEYSGDDLIYKGKNPVFNAVTSATTFLITKYTYTDGNVTK